MKTFKEGDRVNHHRYGAGTVVHAYNQTGSTTVQFDSHGTIMTSAVFLHAVPARKEKMLTNEELLTELLSIQGQVEYNSTLEDLIDTVEKAVADEETEELTSEDTDSFTDADSHDRWESVPANCSVRYRDTL